MTTYTKYHYSKTPTYYAKKAYTIKKTSTNKNVSANVWTQKRMREEMNAHLRENANK